MLKDNHIAATGSIPSAVAAARALCGFSVKIEVECSCADDALAAAGAGADVVMLDNLQPNVLALEAAKVKKQFPHVPNPPPSSVLACTTCSHASFASRASGHHRGQWRHYTRYNRAVCARGLAFCFCNVLFMYALPDVDIISVGSLTQVRRSPCAAAQRRVQFNALQSARRTPRKSISR
jgi:hypothetical protein